MIFNHHTPPSIKPLPAVFLDRDGTINIEKKYLYKRSDWQWIEGVPNAIKQLKEMETLTKITHSGKYGHILTEVTKPQRDILTNLNIVTK